MNATEWLDEIEAKADAATQGKWDKSEVVPQNKKEQ